MLMFSFLTTKNENETIIKQLFCKMIILLKLTVVNDVPSKTNIHNDSLLMIFKEERKLPPRA